MSTLLQDPESQWVTKLFVSNIGNNCINSIQVHRGLGDYQKDFLDSERKSVSSVWPRRYTGSYVIPNITRNYEHISNSLTCTTMTTIWILCICKSTSQKKKVLLRERKRHTACRVASCPNWVPPHGRVPPRLGTPQQVPPAWVPPWLGTPSGWVPPPAGYPPSRLDLAGYPPPGGCPMAFWEMLQSIMGYGYPPPCEQTNKVKLLPSRHTTYAGGNKQMRIFKVDSHVPF